jgi:hypothetical protein
MNDEYVPRQPQDDLNDDDASIDPVILEQNEDMSEVLHEDPRDIRDRMEENEDPDSEQSEDTREQLEDFDQET